jgi:hypothetical protein
MVLTDSGNTGAPHHVFQGMRSEEHQQLCCKCGAVVCGGDDGRPSGPGAVKRFVTCIDLVHTRQKKEAVDVVL